jgi:kynureninase
MAALALRPERTVLLSDTHNFPSDLYVLQGIAQTLGSRHTLRLARGAESAGTQAILDAIDAHTALVVLSHVMFKTGTLYDAQAITRRAHQLGALVLWDLSHSVGAVPVDLSAWQADFAVGCTYKYLNGGPGAPAFLYVRADLQAQAVSPIWGWFGDARPFSFDLRYQPAPGIERLREKSLRQTGYLIDLFDQGLAPLGFSLGTPRDASLRGSHVALRHPEGYRINRALIEEMQVIPDFREPDHIRLGIAPIYTSYIDIWEAVERLRQVVVERRFEHYALDRLTVT